MGRPWVAAMQIASRTISLRLSSRACRLISNSPPDELSIHRDTGFLDALKQLDGAVTSRTIEAGPRAKGTRLPDKDAEQPTARLNAVQITAALTEVQSTGVAAAVAAYPQLSEQMMSDLAEKFGLCPVIKPRPKRDGRTSLLRSGVDTPTTRPAKR